MYSLVWNVKVRSKLGRYNNIFRDNCSHGYFAVTKNWVYRLHRCEETCKKRGKISLWNTCSSLAVVSGTEPNLVTTLAEVSGPRSSTVDTNPLSSSSYHCCWKKLNKRHKTRLTESSEWAGLLETSTHAVTIGKTSIPVIQNPSSLLNGSRHFDHRSDYEAPT